MLGKSDEFPFAKGDVVLAKFTKEIYYAKILSADHLRMIAKLLFDDNSQAEVGFENIFSVNETTSDIICVVCKEDRTNKYNDIVLCDTCSIGFHQKCHEPVILSDVLLPEAPWQCYYCEKNKENPYVQRNPFQENERNNKKRDTKIDDENAPRNGDGPRKPNDATSGATTQSNLSFKMEEIDEEEKEKEKLEEKEGEVIHTKNELNSDLNHIDSSPFEKLKKKELTNRVPLEKTLRKQEKPVNRVTPCSHHDMANDTDANFLPGSEPLNGILHCQHSDIFRKLLTNQLSPAPGMEDVHPEESSTEVAWGSKTISPKVTKGSSNTIDNLIRHERFSRDLPKHNWLVERLKEQGKISEEDQMRDDTSLSNVNSPMVEERSVTKGVVEDIIRIVKVESLSEEENQFNTSAPTSPKMKACKKDIQDTFNTFVPRSARQLDPAVYPVTSFQLKDPQRNAGTKRFALNGAKNNDLHFDNLSLFNKNENSQIQDEEVNGEKCELSAKTISMQTYSGNKEGASNGQSRRSTSPLNFINSNGEALPVIPPRNSASSESKQNIPHQNEKVAITAPFVKNNLLSRFELPIYKQKEIIIDNRIEALTMELRELTKQKELLAAASKKLSAEDQCKRQNLESLSDRLSGGKIAQIKPKRRSGFYKSSSVSPRNGTAHRSDRPKSRNRNCNADDGDDNFLLNQLQIKHDENFMNNKLRINYELQRIKEIGQLQRISAEKENVARKDQMYQTKQKVLKEFRPSPTRHLVENTKFPLKRPANEICLEDIAKHRRMAPDSQSFTPLLAPVAIKPVLHPTISSKRLYSSDRADLSSSSSKSYILSHTTSNSTTKINSDAKTAGIKKAQSYKSCASCKDQAYFLCSECRSAWYCSQQCQLSHWKIHSKKCQKSSTSTSQEKRTTL